MNRTGSKILHGMLLATSAMVGSTMIVSTAAMANPAGGSVAIGSATITNPSASQTVINQSSKRALINWNSFSIQSGASVTFNQPNAKSLTVNRVTGPGSSTINGSLFANGNIWLLNANGILFGKGSQINVGSLMATTSELSDADFKAGNNNFTASSNPNASVINQGTITASRGGSVVLSAPRVSNEGLIQADLGTVVLGGAQAFTVDMTGDNLLRYEISAPVAQAPKDSNGNTATALVSNSGTIAAAGGHVMMTARAARNVEDNVINNTGMVEATSVAVHDGEVDIDAGDGTANVGGTVDVSGNGAGQTGGTVTATGGTVNVADGAKIDASGSAGGGTVLIGGGPHGTGTLAHAQRTIIGTATISADATTKGNGGNVTVWSDGTTQFNGSISAKGGAQGGNGGQVETSGHNLGVSPTAKVDTTAPLGLVGDWLLDPTDILITNDTGQSACCGAGPTCFTPSFITSCITSTDVTLCATQTLTVDTSSSIVYSSSHNLEFDAGTGMTINSLIQNSSNGTIVLDTGNTLTLNAAISVGGNGRLVLHGGDGGSGTRAILDPSGSLLTADTISIQNDGGGTPDQTVGASGAPLEISANHVAAITASGDIYVDSPNGGFDIGDGFNGINGANVALTANGSITQTSAGNSLGVSAETLTVNVAGSGHDILLTDGGGAGDPGNEVTGTVRLGSVAGNVSFANTETTTIGGVTAGGVIDLEITDANQGSGDAELILEGAVNASGAGNTTLHAAGDIINDPFVLNQDTTITADALNLISDNGSIGGPSISTPDNSYFLGASINSLHAQTGETGSIIFSGDKSFVIGIAGDGAGLDIGTGGGYVGAANGSITQLSGGDGKILSTGNISFGAGTPGFVLANGENAVTGDLSLYTPGNATFTNNGGTTLGNIAADLFDSTTVGGNFTVNVVNGPLSQDGALYATNLTIDLTNFVDGTPPVTLTNPANDVTGIFSVTTPGDVSFTNSGTITLGDINDGITIIPACGSTPASTVLNPSEDITITSVNGGINDTGLIAGSSVTLHAHGDVGQTGTLITGFANVSSSVGNITLTNGGNEIDSAFLSASGNAALYDSEDLEVQGADVAGNLTLLTTGDLTFTGSAQSSGGTVLAVAGWDGNATTAAQFAANATTYGNNTGSVLIGGENASGDVVVGGLRGTSVYGYDVTVQSGTLGNAQLGFGEGGSGAINVKAIHDISVSARVGESGESGECGCGSTFPTYATIGNGNSFATGIVGGNITLNAGHDVLLYGEGAYAEIGNRGGGSAVGGTIEVTAVGNVSLNTGADGSTQIGNYGEGDGIAVSGDIFVTANGTGGIHLTTGGEGFYAQIGNYGVGDSPTISGNITVTSNGGGIILSANSASEGLAQIGNDGNDSTNPILSGNIVVNANGSLVLISHDFNSRAQVGNGGWGPDGTASGDINLNVTGNINLSAAGEGASVQIGNGGAESFFGPSSTIGAGPVSGNITIEAGGNISLSGGEASLAQIGNQGFGSTVGGTIEVTADGDISLSGQGEGGFARIGNIGYGEGAQTGGTINVTAEGNVSLVAQGEGSAQIGNAGYNDGSAVNGDISVTANGSGGISLSTAGEGYSALIGNLGSGEGAQIGGNITVIANNGGIILSGTAVDSLARIGNYGVAATDPDVSGDITVRANGGDLDLMATGEGAVAQIGNTSPHDDGIIGGNITASASGDINVTAEADGAVAQIGNGATDHAGAVSGNINVTAAGNLTISATSNDSPSYALIGNGDLTGDSTGSVSGDISVRAGGTIRIDSFGNLDDEDDGDDDVAWLGNIGGTDSGDIESGNVTVRAATVTDADDASFGDIIAADLGSSSAAGSGGDVFVGVNSVSRVGGFSYDSGHTLSIVTEGNLNITNSIQNAGSGAMNFIAGWDGQTMTPASLGNAGVYGNNGGNVVIDGSTSGVSVGSKHGAIIVAGHNVNLNPGNGQAQIGYHGAGATGAITVLATGDITLAAEACCGTCSVSSYAQIGNGGVSNGGTDSGLITVRAAGNISLTAGSGTYNYAQIGNGGDTVSADTDGTTSSANDSGDISVTAGKSISLTGGTDYAQIGNGGWGSHNANANITVNAQNISLNSAPSGTWGYAQIGNGGFSASGNFTGNINVTATGNLALTAGANGLYAQIGNGEDPLNGGTGNSSGDITINAAALTLTGAANASTKNDFVLIGNDAKNGVASGNIAITVSGLTTIDTTDGGGGAAIGNYAQTGSSSGSVTIITGDFDTDHDDDGDSEDFVMHDLAGGDFTIGITDPNAEIEIGGFDYSSAHAFEILAAGSLSVTDDIQNAGTGDITVVAGWNPSVAPGSVASTAGAYGNHNATLTIGGADATDGAHLGSAGGTTTVLTDNLVVDALNSVAQLGYYGTGGGAINVSALGDVTVETFGNNVTAMIGNGGYDVVGLETGSINVTSVNGNISVLGNANDSIATIGNLGGANSSQSGNIAISANNGTLTIGASGSRTMARIGHAANGDTTGTASGDITVHAGATSLIASGSSAFAELGNGDFHLGNDTGTVSGNISIFTGALSLNANGTSGSSQARIGNLGFGAVNGDLSVNATGNILLSASNGGLVNVGNVGDAASPSTGNLSVQSGGTISLLVANGGDARIETGGDQTGTITVNAAGDILLQTSGTSSGVESLAFIGAITGEAGNETISVTSANGNISLLANAAGSTAQIGTGLASPTSTSTDNITVSAANGSVNVAATGANASAIIGASGVNETSALTVAAENVFVTSNGSGALAQIGSIADGAGASANGTVTVIASNAVNVTQTDGTALIGSTALDGGTVSGDTTIIGQSLAGLGGSAVNDLSGGNVTLESLGTGAWNISGGGSVNSAFDLTIESVGDLTIAGLLQNAGSGDITLASDGIVTIGGSGAAGGAAVGSKGGTTTVSGTSVLLSAINGYAQIGYHGGGSGAIFVNATGDITLNGGAGTAYFAQIGDGGYQVSGSNSGAISVLAGGNVTLNAGSGQEAYAQIGNGGAESNSNSTGYTNTGAVTIHGRTVALNAGGGSGSYAQIGDGGYKSGQGLNGVATIGGNIEIDAVSAVTLNGNAADAYAQIGNGGDFINNGAANGSSGTISGNILVAVASPAIAGNAVSATAGSGANSYAQIGNGGNGENTPASGGTVSFNISGDITVNDLALTGSNTGANGYAQIGNGDAAGTGFGNISGDITISKGTVFVLTPGTAPGTDAGIQNNTGTGTVSGSVTGYTGNNPPPPPPPPPEPTSDPTTAGSVSNIIQNSNTPTSYIYTEALVPPQFNDLATEIAGGGTDGDQAPLEKLAGNDEEVASDGVATSVGDSLNGGKAHTTTKTIIPGVLDEIVTLTPRNPHGIPPADEDYSSWGNEAFWRW